MSDQKLNVRKTNFIKASGATSSEMVKGEMVEVPKVIVTLRNDNFHTRNLSFDAEHAWRMLKELQEAFSVFRVLEEWKEENVTYEPTDEELVEPPELAELRKK